MAGMRLGTAAASQQADRKSRLENLSRQVFPLSRTQYLDEKYEGERAITGRPHKWRERYNSFSRVEIHTKNSTSQIFQVVEIIENKYLLFDFNLWGKI